MSRGQLFPGKNFFARQNLGFVSDKSEKGHLQYKVNIPRQSRGFIWEPLKADCFYTTVTQLFEQPGCVLFSFRIFLIPNVPTDRCLIGPHRRNIISASPEDQTRKVPIPSRELPRHQDRALPLQEADHLRYRIFRRDGSIESFEYDVQRRLVKQTSFERVVTTYHYDVYGRLETKKFFDNHDILSGTWQYIYDEFGRVAEIDQDGRITKTIYDAQGRTVKIETPEGILCYTYDKYWRQASVQTDNDPPTYYTYDRFGRLATVSSDEKTTRYEYDAFGNLAKTKTRTGSESLVTVYQYDNINRLVKLSNFVDKNNDGVFNSGDKNVSEFDYTLDLLGRKDYTVEKFRTELSEQKNEIDWEYDNLGRLIFEVFEHYDDAFDQTSDWIYDLVGNRLQQTINGKVTTYDYDVNDRLLTDISGETETLYGYDHTQQTSKKVSESGVLVSETTFAYDSHGRMAVVTIISGSRKEVTKYEYGSDGIRVSAEHEVWEDGNLTSKNRTEYLNDPLSITGYSQVLKQTDFGADGNFEKTIAYVIGNQRISQIVTDNDSNQQEYYFTFDGHGSTRVLLDLVAGLRQIYSFDAYGNALGFDPATTRTEFLYSGEQFDAKIGQQYLRARYYDPTTGRFNRLDPFFGNTTDPQSFHKYLYTHVDPVNGVDPKGEFVIAIAMAVAFGYAGAKIGKDRNDTAVGASVIAKLRSIGITGQVSATGRTAG